MTNSHPPAVQGATAPSPNTNAPGSEVPKDPEVQLVDPAVQSSTAVSSLGEDRISAARLSDLLVKEADWVWNEMADFVRLVQRYRITYVTALFLAVGWSLGQALSDTNKGGTPAVALLDLRSRPDIAAILCVLPFINVMFVMLMLEAQFQMQSLARYRFLLGYELHSEAPVWRWEIWKTTPEGTIRHWTNPSNVLFYTIAVFLTYAGLWFVSPSMAVARELRLLWAIAFTVPLAVAVVVAVIGISRRNVNRVADPPGQKNMTYKKLQRYQRDVRVAWWQQPLWAVGTAFLTGVVTYIVFRVSFRFVP